MIKRCILLLSLLIGLIRAQGQQAGDIDLSFNSADIGYDQGYSANGTINSIVEQPDGRILIAGRFDSYSNTPRDRIARLLADGTLDVSFNPAASTSTGFINSIALQPDGKVILVGYFTNYYNGLAHKNIIRVHANGSIDQSFNPTAGPNAAVSSVILRADGKILIAGQFSGYGNISRNRIALLNNDGTIDTGFDPGVGPDDQVLTMGLQADGKLIVGGIFTSFARSPSQGIARLHPDGTHDGNFTSGMAAGGSVNSVLLEPSGKILIGGSFTAYNGVNKGRVIRLLTNGSLDSSFGSGTGANSSVSSINRQPDGKILITGNFSTYNGISRKRIARLLPDGSLDPGFSPGGDVAGTLLGANWLSGGKIIVIGNYISFDGTPPKYINRLLPDGSYDLSFVPGAGGVNGSVYSITLQPDGKSIIAGSFSTYNNKRNYGITRLASDGNQDISFASGYGPVSINYSEAVYATAVQPDGRIIIGGEFTNNTSLRRDLERVQANGSPDTSFNVPISAFGGPSVTSVRALALQPNGRILIGGEFSSFNGIPRKNIARLLTDGSLDLSFNQGTGANGIVRKIVLQPDGKVLIGGDFSIVNGINRRGIARLNADGSLDQTFNVGLGASGSIYDIVLQADGRMLLGGWFYIFNGVAAQHLIRLHPDGTKDAGFNPGSGPNSRINSVALQPDGKFLITGDFNQFNGISRNKIARLHSNGLVDSTFDPEIGPDYFIYASALQSDGKLLIGGGFTSYNNTGRNRLARILGASVTASIATGSLNATAICQGTTISVPFSISSTFNPANTFKAELSDAGGSFASPVVIGTLAGNQSGIISATIPAGTPSGAGYRVRVISTAPATTGTYSAIAFLVTGPPNVQIAASRTTICLGNSVQLTASGASQYSWGAGNGLTTFTGSQVSATPTSTGTFIYSVTGNKNGCFDTETIAITVTSPLPVSITASVPVICLGGSTTITASGASTYTWSNGQAGSSITVSPTATTTYTVTGKNNDCTATSSITVTVNPLPVVLVAASQASVCKGESVTLNATGATSYTWSNGQTGNSITVSPLLTTPYTVTGNSNGCTSIKSVTVIVVPPLQAPVITSNSPVCAGNSLQLQASSVPGATFSWTGPNSFSSTLSNPVIPQVSAVNAGVYTVSATDGNGCKSQASWPVKISLADSTFSYWLNGQTCFYTANGSGTYNWSFPGGTPAFSSAQSVTVSYAGQGTYPVSLTTVTPAGCSATTTQIISVLNNEEQLAADFKLYPNPTNGFVNVEIQSGFPEKGFLYIYNLLGQRVFNTEIQRGQLKFTIDLSGQPAGLYLISFVTSNGILDQKITKL